MSHCGLELFDSDDLQDFFFNVNPLETFYLWPLVQGARKKISKSSEPNNSRTYPDVEYHTLSNSDIENNVS